VFDFVILTLFKRTSAEMQDNLGTIARSGTQSFLESIKKETGATEDSTASQIIGRFGVGFYSVFMVANKVTVFSRSADANSVAHVWTSDGSGTFEMAEASGVARGTKIIIDLKPTCAQFASASTIRDAIAKYSNFVQVWRDAAMFLNVIDLSVSSPFW
jgi:TNF receptor-associated protein 1